MLKKRKRDGWYHIEGRISGTRLRLALRTKNGDRADDTIREVENALAKGPESDLWKSLKGTLPENSFAKLAAIVGYIDKPVERKPTCTELRDQFKSHCIALIARGKLRGSTWKRYERALKQFGIFLDAEGLFELEAITKPALERFKSWRVQRICESKQSKGGSGLLLELAILHGIFGYALENEMVLRNPVKTEGRAGDNERGAQPYSVQELSRMRQVADDDFTAFILLLRTGMRGGDVVGLCWEEVDWSANEINRVTEKRSKRVLIPMSMDLRFALEAEHEKRKPEPEHRVLLNPATGSPLTRSRLYERIRALGRRANVVHAHPHRFRDTFAVDMLHRGAGLYEVAELLGDTAKTVQKHYAPFTRELRDRVKRLMDNDQGLENLGTIRAQTPEKTEQVQ
jgi:integrase